MKSEVKNCQNCKKDFTIEEEDFNFYEKIKVPPPTFCPKCRLIRRMAWRNERVLYKRGCDLCQKKIISMYPESVVFPVYCRDCWWGDGWDATSYGRDFDFSKTFFEQFKELQKVVPRVALFQRNSINCDFSNMVGESKNVYLSASVIKNSENVFYSKCIDNSQDIVDCLNVISGSNNLYENVEAQGNYNSQYLLLCRAMVDSFYCFDCVNCSSCVLSYNLRNKKFCIRNKQYSKDKYFEELKKMNLKSRKSRDILLKEFKKIKEQAIYRFGNITKCVNVTGNNLLNVKNSKNCFEVYNAEDSSHCFRAFDFKECMDFDFGGWSELMYECVTGAQNDYNVKFSHAASAQLRNVDYTDFCQNCSDIFGCIGLRNNKYTILNKVYNKEDFFDLRKKIIEHMNRTPYIDQGGRIYKYGEFFPIELSFFGYSETLAHEIDPLSQEQAVKLFYPWRNQNIKNFNISISADKIPDSIDEVGEDILKEALGCLHKGECNHQCYTAFKLTDFEFKFYKKNNIPIPILCANCRHYERFIVMPGENLYQRKCMCDKTNHFHGRDKCEVEFETSYSPDRPETVYCEKCYQQEVY